MPSGSVKLYGNGRAPWRSMAVQEPCKWLQVSSICLVLGVRTQMPGASVARRHNIHSCLASLVSVLPGYEQWLVLNLDVVLGTSGCA